MTDSQLPAGVHGLHHVTATAGPPQENIDFYAGVLGTRLVKRSVNQDDPGPIIFSMRTGKAIQAAT